MNRLHAAVLAGAVSVAAVPAAAQELIAEYYAWIGPQDMVNSSGERLRDWCAMIQQDRANYHRFGLRDEGDWGDPVFGSREARAAIAGNCQTRPDRDFVPRSLESGTPTYVYVRVYGRGDRPQAVVVWEGPG
jgi:hypothetical protein